MAGLTWADLDNVSLVSFARRPKTKTAISCSMNTKPESFETVESTKPCSLIAHPRMGTSGNAQSFETVTRTAHRSKTCSYPCNLACSTLVDLNDGIRAQTRDLTSHQARRQARTEPELAVHPKMRQQVSIAWHTGRYRRFFHLMASTYVWAPSA